jgi:hypothetical protein
LRINIYDSQNTRRLLGSIDSKVLPSPRKSAGMRGYRLACLSRAPLDFRDPYGGLACCPTIRDVQLDYAGLEVPEGGDGWTEQRFLTTSSRLEDLMTVTDFRLPGESPRSAEARRYYF